MRMELLTLKYNGFYKYIDWTLFLTIYMSRRGKSAQSVNLLAGRHYNCPSRRYHQIRWDLQRKLMIQIKRDECMWARKLFSWKYQPNQLLGFVFHFAGYWCDSLLNTRARRTRRNVACTVNETIFRCNWPVDGILEQFVDCDNVFLPFAPIVLVLHRFWNDVTNANTSHFTDWLIWLMVISN